nr:uncharacterized protein LOC109192823 [Ipomoea batatas]
MEEDGREQQQEDHFTPSGFQPPSDTLPRIRTNFRSGHRQQGQGRPDPSFEPHMDRPTHTPQDRGGFRGRGGRGGGPNRAAADSEHTVVRGSNRGKDITSTAVYHNRALSPSPSLADYGNTYKHRTGEELVSIPAAAASRSPERVTAAVVHLAGEREKQGGRTGEELVSIPAAAASRSPERVTAAVVHLAGEREKQGGGRETSVAPHRCRVLLHREEERYALAAAAVLHRRAPLLPLPCQRQYQQPSPCCHSSLTEREKGERQKGAHRRASPHNHHHTTLVCFHDRNRGEHTACSLKNFAAYAPVGNREGRP